MTVLLLLQNVEVGVVDADVRKPSGTGVRRQRGGGGAASSVASAAARSLQLARGRAQTFARTAVLTGAHGEASSAAHDPPGRAHLRVDTASHGTSACCSGGEEKEPGSADQPVAAGG